MRVVVAKRRIALGHEASRWRSVDGWAAFGTEAGDPTPRSCQKLYVVVFLAFGRLLTRFRAPVRACYEAGPCGFALQRFLTAQHIPCEEDLFTAH